MGHCLSRENNDDSFTEVERRKTRDGDRGKGQSGDDTPNRRQRKSSGLSNYSNDCQHVIEQPLRQRDTHKRGSRPYIFTILYDLYPLQGCVLFWIYKSLSNIHHQQSSLRHPPSYFNILEFRFAAFNVKRFGISKFKDTETVNILIRYVIMFSIWIKNN